MARRPTTEDRLLALNAVRDDPHAAGAAEQLARALEQVSSHVVAKAANIIAEAELVGLAPAVASTLARFLDAPAEMDRGCAAKAALADAAYRLGVDRGDLLVRGVQHVQIEPSFGRPVDTGAQLRAACAMALVRIAHPDALVHLADLLADPEPVARLGAARALGYLAHAAAAPLLRFKIRSRDSEMAVLSECMSALLAAGGDAALDLLVEQLEVADPAVQEAAALALGSSMRVDAVEPLRGWAVRNRDPEQQRIGFLALATLRQEAGFAFLLDVIETGPLPAARLACDAMAIFRDDDKLSARVRDAAMRRMAAGREDLGSTGQRGGA